MSDTIRVAAIQMRSGPQPDDNLAALEGLVAEAVSLGARYVLTPEVTVAFAENREGLVQVTHPAADNPHIGRAAEIADAHDVFLHLGSLAVALEDGRFANRSILFGRDGRVLAQYDKIHLFDATLPGLNAYRESATYRGGDKAVLARAAGFALGMSICYDMRFPMLFNTLAKAGAQVIAIPAAFTVPTGQAHWHTLLRARAIETGCYVIAAAQGGRHANGRSTYGHSLIVDPWGTIMAEAEGDEPCVILADLDLDRVREARERVPALANGREFSLQALGADAAPLREDSK